MPEEEAISCMKNSDLYRSLMKKETILVRYQSIFTLINVKKILKTYKMYLKTLIYLISRIRYLILAVKGQNNPLIKHRYVFCNVTNQ